MDKLIKALKETGEYEDTSYCLLYGNPITPSSVVIFEKAWVFEIAVNAFKNQMKNLFICMIGIPCPKCINFIKTIKTKKLIYLGDLDPTSFFTFLTLSYAKRKPNPKDKPKLKINYAGVTLKDYQKYLSAKEESLIKLPEYEKVILNFVEKFKLQNLRQEIEFLKRTGRKVEIEGICRCFKIVQSKKIQKEKIKEFENYLKVKLKI